MNMSTPILPLQYLCLKSLTHKESGSRSILQPNLAIDAELSPLMAVSPKPPSSMGLVTVVRAKRCDFRSMFISAHKIDPIQIKPEFKIH